MYIVLVTAKSDRDITSAYGPFKSTAEAREWIGANLTEDHKDYLDVRITLLLEPIE